jgi:hypothetical protein
MKNLVYFASGLYKEDYQNLPYDNIYLIDSRFRFNTNQQITGKVTCLKMDALEAANHLIDNKIFIDCFVSINEGLFGGGGNYVINSDAFMGYVFPILREQFVHIIDRSYYNYPYIVKMNWPVIKKEINMDDDFYIDPNLFSTVTRANYGNVYLIKKDVKKRKLNLACNTSVFVVNDSIWSDYNTADLFFLSINNPNTNEIFYSKPNVFNINEFSFNEVLSLCEENKIAKIRMMPWLRGQYTEIINAIIENKNEYPKEIHFYHMNKKDYKSFIEN